MVLRTRRFPRTAFVLAAGISALGAGAQTFMSNWPNPNDIVGSVAYDPVSDLVFIGGNFTSVDGQPRDGLASFYASSGTLTSWAPDLGIGGVSSMSIVDARLYIGGSFDEVDGTTRNSAASFDIPSGTLNNWNPNVSSTVWDMDASTSAVYLTGQIFTVQGQSRDHFAAVNTTGSGTPTAFDVGYCDDYGYAVAVEGNVTYCGGEFYYIGGQTRPNIAAVNATTGAVTSWNPGADGWVTDLAVGGSTVYAAGNFYQCGGESRYGVAAIDATTGDATTWNAQSNDWVNSVAVNAGTVYVGGPFNSIGGQARNGFAALSATTGAALPWNPVLENGPNDLFIATIQVYPPYLFVGGDFTTVGGTPHGYLAAFSGIVAGVEEAPAIPQLQVAPNPTTGQLTLGAQQPDMKTVEVQNVLGERVLALPYQRTIDLGRLAPGPYSITVRNADGAALARARVVRE